MTLPTFLKNKYFLYSVSIIIILSIALYFTTKQNEIDNTESSTDRISEIDRVMRHYLGDYWTYVVVIIFILISIVLFMTQKMLSSTTTNLIDINESKRKILIMFMIAAIIFFSVCVVIVSSNSYINDTQSDTVDWANKDQLKEDRKQYVQIAVLLTVSFILLTLATQWIYKKYKQL